MKIKLILVISLLILVSASEWWVGYTMGKRSAEIRSMESAVFDGSPAPSPHPHFIVYNGKCYAESFTYDSPSGGGGFANTGHREEVRCPFRDEHPLPGGGPHDESQSSVGVVVVQ